MPQIFSPPGRSSRACGYAVPDLAAGVERRAQLTVRRSRFIAVVGRTAGVDACKGFIAAISAASPDASHHCFAYNAGAPGSTACVGCSDDGEPHGSAGQPMLNILLHCGCGEITAVVIRYFGGTKLGIGGLVKAYQDSVKAVLAGLPRTVSTPVYLAELQIPLPDADAFAAALARAGIDVRARTCVGGQMRYRLSVAAPYWPKLQKLAAVATAGRVRYLNVTGG